MQSRDRRKGVSEKGRVRVADCRITFHGLPAHEVLSRIKEEHERRRYAPAHAMAGTG